MKRTHTTMQVTCLVCHKDMDDRTGVRSLTWYEGLPGTRAILCSPECQSAFDAENLSHIHDMMESNMDELLDSADVPEVDGSAIREAIAKQAQEADK